MSDHAHDRILVEHQDGCHVVRFLQDTFLDPLELAEISTQIQDLIKDDPPPRVVLAMDTVRHMPSAMISTLIAARAACEARGGRAALAAAPTPVMEILRVAKLDEVFETYDSVADAVVALQG